MDTILIQTTFLGSSIEVSAAVKCDEEVSTRHSGKAERECFNYKIIIHIIDKIGLRIHQTIFTIYTHKKRTLCGSFLIFHCQLTCQQSANVVPYPESGCCFCR